MRHLRIAWLSGLALAPCPAAATCDPVEPPAIAAAVERRPLLPEDLVSLRDIGPSPAVGELFTLSPDQRLLALQLRRADTGSNSYCLAMLVMAAQAGARPIIVDRGGELIRRTSDFRGRAATETGLPLTITPRWSPDGTWIAFLKRVNSRTQVWRADASGRGSAPITASDTDVEDFRVSPDGEAIIFVTRPALNQAREAIEREGLRGFHYDDRYAPAASSRPFPAMPLPTEMFSHDIATGRTRVATAEEARMFRVAPDGADDAVAFAMSASGRKAWIRASPGEFYRPRLQLVAQDADGATITCEYEACNNRLGQPWWVPEGQRLRYFRREDPRAGSNTIYEWEPGLAPPRRIFSTDDLVSDCQPIGDKLICIVEGSVAPRRVVLLDPDTGRTQLLLDPNPEFAQLRLGEVQRLYWTNEFGLETIGDLVLPVSYRPGRRYPLIIVQYDTRGFLRGGTGDEYPIQAFANRGYAVLSFSRPDTISARSDAQNAAESGRINLTDFADRRSVHSSLAMAIQSLVDRGIADPRRIGITGLSDGASTTEFALLNSNLFSAAALSQCCWSPFLLARVGPAAARHFREEGYPLITNRDAPFWRGISMAVNPRSVTAPILVQMADSEYLSAVDTFAALREVGAAIEMFVFPNETHIKWQPAHRLAAYRRVLDWFDYWLRDIRPTDPERQNEVTHWDDLRRGLRSRQTPAEHAAPALSNGRSTPPYREDRGSARNPR